MATVAASIGATNPVLYVFSSTAGKLYIQDPLNVLALPQGYVYHFRYSVDRIAPALRPYENMTDAQRDAFDRKLDDYKSCEALVVFVDQAGDRNKRGNFYPLRRATIHHLERQGTILHVYFTVGEYVGWPNIVDADQLNGKVNEFTEAIADATDNVCPPGVLLTPIEGSFPDAIQYASGEEDEIEANWQHIVEALSHVAAFEKTVFYRVTGLTKIDSPWWRRTWSDSYFWRKSPPVAVPVPLLQPIPGRSGFEMKSGKIYTMGLNFYHSEATRDTETGYGPVTGSKLVPMIDKTYFAFEPDKVEMNFRYDRRAVDLISKPIDQDAYTTLTLQIEPPSESATTPLDITAQTPLMQAEPAGQSTREPELLAPNLRFLLKLGESGMSFWVAFALLVVGQFLIWFGANLILRSPVQAAPVSKIAAPLVTPSPAANSTPIPTLTSPATTTTATLTIGVTAGATVTPPLIASPTSAATSSTPSPSGTTTSSTPNTLRRVFGTDLILSEEYLNWTQLVVTALGSLLTLIVLFSRLRKLPGV